MHPVPTIRLKATTTATAEQFIAAVTDFGPGRWQIFGNTDDGQLKVHDQETDWADVTEGGKGPAGGSACATTGRTRPESA